MVASIFQAKVLHHDTLIYGGRAIYVGVCIHVCIYIYIMAVEEICGFSPVVEC